MKSLLKTVNIEARDLPEAHFLSIRELFKNGYLYRIDKSSSGPILRLEFDDFRMKVIYPGTRPLVPDYRSQGIPPPVDMKYIEEDYIRYLITPEKKREEEYTYGEDLHWQIEWVIRYYKKYGPNLNHCYMTVGRPESLKNYEREGGTSQCLRGIDTRIRYGALHFFVYFRSWDLWGGFPANLAAVQLLKEYMAKEIGVKDGELIAYSKGLHLYEHAFGLAFQISGLSKEEVLSDLLPFL